MIFTSVNGILQAEINRVKAHGARNLFNVTVERPISLWHAVAAECARGRRIRVDHICIEADVGRFAIFSIADIQRHCLVTCVARHGQCVTAVRARV